MHKVAGCSKVAFCCCSIERRLPINVWSERVRRVLLYDTAIICYATYCVPGSKVLTHYEDYTCTISMSYLLSCKIRLDSGLAKAYQYSATQRSCRYWSCSYYSGSKRGRVSMAWGSLSSTTVDRKLGGEVSSGLVRYDTPSWSIPNLAFSFASCEVA